MRVDGLDHQFWNGKRVLLTGHTGFKGSWASLWLSHMGAKVTGISLPPETNPNLFDLACVKSDVRSHLIDLRDREAISRTVKDADPHIVIHMAAQPLVRRSYSEPVETFAANVMGTVHLLEALRGLKHLSTVLVITTDKVYQNAERGTPFREDDPLGGHDPYAASKAATEIVAASYAQSYLIPNGVRLATARGGNVIGGGDFSQDRIVPDIWRAAQDKQKLVLRYPHAARPWQHVLDCLNGYFSYTRGLHENIALPDALNFGPPTDAATLTVAELASAVQSAVGFDQDWEMTDETPPKEMSALALNSDKARNLLGWRDHLTGTSCIDKLADWYRALGNHQDMRAFTLAQIEAYEALHRASGTEHG